MIIPPNLKKGDKVIILSTARNITLSQVKPFEELLSSWGLNVVLGKTIGNSFNQFSGEDAFRAFDLQNAINNSDIKAIFCAKGGYGTVRLLDRIDYSLLKINPKWIIGYSDVTALINHLYFNVNLCAIHGIMAVNIENIMPTEATQSLYNILFNSNNTIHVQFHPYNRMGIAEGKMIGGNLSVLYSLLSSPSLQSTEGCILVLEDLDEYLYHIDRMLQALDRANKLSKLTGLVIGQFTKMHDNEIPFGLNSYQIIKDITYKYHYPVAFNLPIGHISERNHAFICGKRTKLIVNEEQTTIIQ